MREISIRELHDKTGKWVREAARVGELVVTERGRPIYWGGAPGSEPLHSDL